MTDSTLSKRELSISILIPFRDKVELLEACIESILNKTKYKNYQIVLINNQSQSPKTITYLKKILNHSKISLINYQSEFNFSAINNTAVELTISDLVVLLNNDVEIISTDWLDLMKSEAIKQNVAAVGALLLYDKNKIQHAGIGIAVSDALCENLYSQQDLSKVQSLPFFNNTSQVDAVTAACMMIERKKYKLVDGLNEEQFKVAFNDVDFCIRLEKIGFINVLNPLVKLLHHESKTRTLDCYDESGQFRNEIRNLKSLHKKRLKVRSKFLDVEHYKIQKKSSPPLLGQTVVILAIRLKKGYGVDLVIEQQAKGLLNLGLRVIVAVFDFEYINNTPPPFKVLVIPKQRTRKKLTSYLKKVIKKQKASFVIAHTSPFFEVLPSLNSLVKTIAYEHGDPNPSFFPGEYIKRQLVKKHKERKVYPFVSELIAISYFISMDINAPRSKILYNGIDHLNTQFSAQQRNEFYKKMALEPRKICLLMVTRLGIGEARYKGTNKYIELVHILGHSRYEFILIGAGDSTDGDIYKRAGIKVLLNASNTELSLSYHTADLLISFSKWEGFNLPIAEASHFQLATLALSTAVHKEVSQLVVDTFSDAVNFIKLQSKESLKRLGEKQYSFLKRYSWQSNINNLYDILSRINTPTLDHIDEKYSFSLCIVTKDQLHLVKPCLESIFKHSRGVKYEVLIADSGSTDKAVLDFYDSLPQNCKVYFFNYYNFSRLNNFLAAKAQGENLIFLNNDTLVLQSNWLKVFKRLLMSDTAGAIGPLLSFPDKTIQHAGVEFYSKGKYKYLAHHPFRTMRLSKCPPARGTFEVPALTGACLCIKKTIFDGVGGFDNAYFEECQDIDLCLKISQKGYSCIYSSSVELIHFENGTREQGEYVPDRVLFTNKWRKFIGKKYLRKGKQRTLVEH